MHTADFVGIWQLISFEARLADGTSRQPMGPNPVGRIVYDDRGRMVVVLARAQRPPLAGADKTRAPLEEKAAALDSFEAYFGTYSVDADRGVVTHHVEAALFPNWAGTQQERFFAFSDNRLELSTAPIAYGGDTMTAVLTWERLGEPR